MKEAYPLYGIVTVSNTPFTKENQIDETGLRRNNKDVLKAGVVAFTEMKLGICAYKVYAHFFKEISLIKF
jgi:4-hydroxy-tetrahydrodipicolinate synthase